MNDISTPEKETNEISIKDILKSIKDGFAFLLSKWKILIVAGLLGAAIGLSYSLLETPKYVAKLTFVLEDVKSNPLEPTPALQANLE